MRVLITIAAFGILCGVAMSLKAAEPALEPLLMSYVASNSSNLDLSVAQAKGFLAEQGFAPQQITINGSVQSEQLLLTEAVHVALAQSESLAGAVVHGSKEVAGIAAAMRRLDWMLVGQPDVRDLASLKGKTVGFSGLRVTEFWLTQKVMQERGIPLDGIQVGTTPAKFAALTKGSIAAAVLYEPTASLALSMGYSNLFEFGSQPGYIPGIYTVSRKWAAENQHGLRLSRAFQNVHAWLYDPKNRDEVLGFIKQFSKVPDAVARVVYDKYFVTDKWYSADGAIETAAVQDAIASMVANHQIDEKSAPKAEDVMLPHALGGLWH